MIKATKTSLRRKLMVLLVVVSLLLLVFVLATTSGGVVVSGGSDIEGENEQDTTATQNPQGNFPDPHDDENDSKHVIGSDRNNCSAE